MHKTVKGSVNGGSRVNLGSIEDIHITFSKEETIPIKVNKKEMPAKTQTHDFKTRQDAFRRIPVQSKSNVNEDKGKLKNSLFNNLDPNKVDGLGLDGEDLNSEDLKNTTRAKDNDNYHFEKSKNTDMILSSQIGVSGNNTSDIIHPV